MRAVVQRVKRAQVTVGNELLGRIGPGLLVLIAAGRDDEQKQVQWMAQKLVSLRIFADAESKMNLSLLDVAGSVLVVSQFTLYGECRKGKRPSYTQSASSERALVLYEMFIGELRKQGVTVEQGRFGAMMDVELVNDGPVTLIVDSPD